MASRSKSLIPKGYTGKVTEDMLNDRQKSILNFVRSYSQAKGYPPSVREICAGVGLLSTASVHNHLHKLQDLGFINRDTSKPRALELTADQTWRNKAVVPVSLVGKVTAGIPILAVENVEETYPIPLDLIGTTEEVFMLEVSGDSMINAGILDHDYIVVRKQNFANNGDIVVALIDGEETTVKRYFKDLRNIRLQPENEAFSPIIGGDNIQVMGKVIALFRMV